MQSSYPIAQSGPLSRFGQPLLQALHRLGALWWQGMQRQARERCGDEHEALEQVRDRWRR